MRPLVLPLLALVALGCGRSEPHYTGFVEGEERTIRSEVTGRVLEVLESARRAGIRVFFTRHCCCRTRPPVRPRWSARRFVAIGASHA